MGLIESLIYIGIAQSFLLVIAVGVFRKDKRNSFLILFLVSTLLILVGRLQYITSYGAGIWWFFLFTDGAFYIYGLGLYSHLKKNIFYWTGGFSKLHFIPLCLYLLVAIIVLILYAANFELGSKYNLMEKFHFFREPTKIIHNLIYLYLSIRLIVKYSKEEHENIAYEQPTIKYLKLLILISTASVLLWVGVYLNNNFLQLPITSFLNYGIVWVGMIISTFLISLFSITTSPLFRIEEKTVSDNPNLERLSEARTNELKAALDRLIRQEKIYRNQQLKLPDLSASIDCSINDLSWLINNVYQKSFYDFINHYRVLEFVNRLEDNEYKNETLLSIRVTHLDNTYCLKSFCYGL